MKHIAILGSTGSVGTQTLDVIQAHPSLFKVVSLAAGSNKSLIIKQAHQFQPEILSVSSRELAEQIKKELPSRVKVVYGNEGLLEAATFHRADVVVTAVVGSVGLQPTLAAIEAGKTIALANKETLVTAGHLVMEKVKQCGVHLLPVDSEHSAIFQCLNGENKENIQEIILTASGGSFRHKSREELVHVTVEEALAHPNWSMGSKITIDSATMMNKGLEVIEAHWLFQLSFEKIKVLLHDESIIHSMVLFKDQAVMAQLGTPDMKGPIQYALTYPERLPLESKPLNLAEIGRLHFREPDFSRYRCLRMSYEAGKAGGTMPTVLNAANEVAVSRFLRAEISFLQIEQVIEAALEKHQVIPSPSLAEVESVDRWAREFSFQV